MSTIPGRGLFFDEFEVGAVYAHEPSVTITQADNVVFCELTHNAQPLHVDEEYAGATEFGRPLINSMWTLATMVGASVVDLTAHTLVAQLGLSDITFPSPLFPGDTLSTETEVVAVRPSRSRPGQGIVTLRHTGRNQHGEIVALATRTALMKGGPE